MEPVLVKRKVLRCGILGDSTYTVNYNTGPLYSSRTPESGVNTPKVRVRSSAAAILALELQPAGSPPRFLGSLY